MDDAGAVRFGICELEHCFEIFGQSARTEDFHRSIGLVVLRTTNSSVAQKRRKAVYVVSMHVCNKNR